MKDITSPWKRLPSLKKNSLSNKKTEIPLSLGKDGALISCQKMVSQHCRKKYASNSHYVTQERGIRSVTSETKMWKLFF